MTTNICSVENCGKRVFGNGLCNMHYMRVRRHGTLEPTGKKQPQKGVRTIPTCGHPDRRHYGHGLCGGCYSTLWHKNNPEKGHAGWVKRNPEKVRALYRKYNLKNKFGLTPEDRVRMWEAQQGKCANPGCQFVGNKESIDHRRDGLVIDHNHKTGKIRGMLCSGCNLALGRLNEDVRRMRGLATYLESHS